MVKDKMQRVMKVYTGKTFMRFIFIIWLGLPSSNASGGYVNSDDGGISNHNEQHSLRHRQHYYNQRMEQASTAAAANNLKNSHHHQTDHKNYNGSHVYLRHHNHHQLLHQHAPPLSSSPTYSHGGIPPSIASSMHSPTSLPSTLTSKHHLRHHNRHHQTWEQRVFPSLQHQQQKPTVAPMRHSGHSYNHHHNSSDEGSAKENYDHRYAMNHRNYEVTTQGPLKPSDSYTNLLRSFNYQNQRHDKSHEVNKLKPMAKDIENNDDNSLMIGVKIRSKSKSKWKDEESKENMDDYYEDENTEDDEDDDSDDDDSDNDGDDYSEEKEGDSSSSHDETTNRIDERILPKRRTEEFDTENIYSRSYIPGTLTRYKYEMLGTHEAVEKSRMSHITNQKQHRALANAHATKIFLEATCKYPKPRIEKIQKDPSKIYYPHCTILHRCADDTGCCSTDSHTCVAKHTQSVDLYFFVKTFGSKQGAVEKHTFINHTECHCVDKAKHLKYPPEPATLRQATILDCNCPKLFEKVLQEDGYCRCDCSSSNSGCDWLKRGMEHFSVIDRKCISEGRCKPPTCEYGEFMRKHGRCPRKDDKMTAYSTGYL